MGNTRLYATLANVDPTQKEFDATFPMKMSALLDECLVNENTIILMNTALRSEIANRYTTFKNANALIKFDDRFNMSICGIPVVASQNIPLNTGKIEVATP